MWSAITFSPHISPSASLSHAICSLAEKRATVICIVPRETCSRRPTENGLGHRGAKREGNPSTHSHPLLPRITCTHTQDKACIDQSNIQQSLACLPVFLAGCQTLLVVAGPTYCSRLWCVMELFTFARSERLLHTYSNLARPLPRDDRVYDS